MKKKLDHKGVIVAQKSSFLFATISANMELEVDYFSDNEDNESDDDEDTAIYMTLCIFSIQAIHIHITNI